MTSTDDMDDDDNDDGPFDIDGRLYVFAQRPRCPECGGWQMHATRTLQRDDIAIKRREVCATCGCKFVLILE